MRNEPRRGRYALLTGAAAVLLLAAAGASPVTAAGVSWEKRGAFESCLDERLDTWVRSKAEMIVNEDPAIAALDDVDVALWAVTVLQGCEAQAGSANTTSEGRFSRYMAHWRDHIHNTAQTISKTLAAD